MWRGAGCEGVRIGYGEGWEVRVRVESEDGSCGLGFGGRVEGESRCVRA